MPAPQRDPRGQQGQALVVAAVALVIFSLLASVGMTLWVRQAALASRQAHRQTAHYAAEAGITAGLTRLTEGDESFLSGAPVTGQVGRGGYQVRLASAASGAPSTYVLESTGWALARPHERRTVRVALESAFFHPAVSARDLAVNNCFEFIFTWYCAEVSFSPDAVYTRNLEAPGRQQVLGVRQASVPLPRLTYGAVASRVPNPENPIPLKTADCVMGTSGWYELRSRSACRSSIHVAAPWVGITGDVDVDTLNVDRGAVLVVAGRLEVDRLQFANAAAGTGQGAVVAGKDIEVETVDLVNWGSEGVAALYALDTNTPDCTGNLPGCTYNRKRPNDANDPSNDVSITEFSLVVRGPTSRMMSLFAAPFRVPPGNGAVPRIHLHLGGGLGTVGETSIAGALVSAGDIELSADTGILDFFKSPWRVRTDPRSLRPFLELAGSVPGSGALVQLGWTEEAGGGS